MLGVDHDKIILLSTPFPTIPMLGKNCCYNVIVFFVGNKRCCTFCSRIVGDSRLITRMTENGGRPRITSFGCVRELTAMTIEH